MKIKRFLESTRFFIIQESIFFGFVGCILYATVLPKFPYEAFLIFLGPVAIGAYGIKTFEHVKGEANGRKSSLESLSAVVPDRSSPDTDSSNR
jgi:hypothetical protein